MSTGRVRIRESHATTDPPSYLLTVDLQSGFVRSGMKLVIPLNGGTAFSVGIKDVGPGPTPSQLILSLDPLDKAGVILLKALNLCGDELECLE